jgi:iron(III) transport system substrate-binding protein
MRQKIFLPVFFFVMMGTLPFVAAAQSAPQADWEKVIAAAKQEGRVIVYGAPEITMQNALTEFQKSYPEIQVTLVSGSGSALVSRILAERRGGKFLMDVSLFGHNSNAALQQAKALDPITPALSLPEIKDPSLWWRGRHWYGDEENQYIFIFSGYLTSPLALNTKLFNPEEIRSYWDLFNPKWKGKILSFDPRQRGPITDVTTFFYYHPDLGSNFLTRLYGGEMALSFTSDYRQGLDWLGQGKYWLAIGMREVDDAKKKGLPVEEFNPDRLKEGTYITPGFGTVAAGNNPPHPNATRLFVNWFLSRQGQTAWQRHTGNTSLRRDIAKDYLPPRTVPKENGNYFFMALPQQKMDEGTARKFVAGLLEK